MTAPVQPALAALVARIDRELLFAQVLIRRTPAGCELRHVSDAGAEPGALRLVPIAALRHLAQTTACGAFRPLKSAPNLQTGWRAVAVDEAALESALHALYPGAVPDWFAAQAPSPPVTHYREFTERQTGMYRITTMLNDAQAAGVIRACCHRRFCLRQRLWGVAGLDADRADEKSLIPCLEPCAVLLEFGRKAMRIEQEEKARLEFAPDELATIQAALQSLLTPAGSGVREADFNSPSNPRRAQWLLDRLPPPLGGLPANADSFEK